jgi:hypothetical protein
MLKTCINCNTQFNGSYSQKFCKRECQRKNWYRLNRNKNSNKKSKKHVRVSYSHFTRRK